MVAVAYFIQSSHTFSREPTKKNNQQAFTSQQRAQEVRILARKRKQHRAMADLSVIQPATHTASKQNSQPVEKRPDTH